MSYLPLYAQFLYVSSSGPNASGEVYGSCPFHEDTSPSFSFNDVTGLWYCFSCKKGGDAASFIMRMENIPYVEAQRRVAELLGEPVLPTEEQVNEWQEMLHSSPTTLAYLERRRITDEELLRRYKIGFDGERITVPVYDTEGNLKNVRRLRLPGGAGDKAYNWRGFGRAALWPEDQLKEKSLVLCAGEFDCLSVLQQGYNAVTGTGGESVWLKEWSERFLGKTVYIAYDGDETGRREAQNVARALQGFAEQVYILDLPDGEDVNSLHAQGRCLADFIEKARKFSTGPRILTGFELLLEAEQEARQPWIVEGLLRPGWLGVLSGHAKGGKTTLLSHLAAAINSGGSFLDRNTTKVPVVYMNYEMPTEGLVEMFRSTSDGQPELWPLVMQDPPKPLTPEVLIPFLGDKPGLAIIDSAVAAFMFRGDDENSAGEVGHYLRGLLSLARHTRWTFLIIHHLAKYGDSPAGSREWLAAPDVIWKWDKKKGSDHGTFSVEGRIPPCDDLRVRLSYNECTVIGEVVHDADEKEKIEAVRRYLRGFPGQTLTKIAEDLDISKKKLRAILCEANGFRKEGSGTNQHDPFRWFAAD